MCQRKCVCTLKHRAQRNYQCEWIMPKEIWCFKSHFLAVAKLILFLGGFYGLHIICAFATLTFRCCTCSVATEEKCGKGREPKERQKNENVLQIHLVTRYTHSMMHWEIGARQMFMLFIVIPFERAHSRTTNASYTICNIIHGLCMFSSTEPSATGQNTGKEQEYQRWQTQNAIANRNIVSSEFSPSLFLIFIRFCFLLFWILLCVK